MKNISVLQKQVFETATNSGWHDSDERICTSPWWRRLLRPFGVRQTFGAPTARQKLAWLALITDELDEAKREDEYLYYTGLGNKPEGILVELTDALIRVLDMSAACGVDLGAFITDEDSPYDYDLWIERNNLVNAIRTGNDTVGHYAALFLAIENEIERARKDSRECEGDPNPPSVEDLVILKDAYNRTRGYRHGGKLA